MTGDLHRLRELAAALRPVLDRVTTYVAAVDERNAHTAERGSGQHVGPVIAGDPYTYPLNLDDVRALAAAVTVEVTEIEQIIDDAELDARAAAEFADFLRGAEGLGVAVFRVGDDDLAAAGDDERDRRDEELIERMIEKKLADAEAMLDARDMDRGEL